MFTRDKRMEEIRQFNAEMEAIRQKQWQDFKKHFYNRNRLTPNQVEELVWKDEVAEYAKRYA